MSKKQSGIRLHAQRQAGLIAPSKALPIRVGLVVNI